MASPRTFPTEDASVSIQRTGLYTLEDHAVGDQVKEFSKRGFPTKSPAGLEFVVQNSFAREDIHHVLVKTLHKPRLGLIKIWSYALPSDYAFRLHNGAPGDPVCLLVHLFSPDSIVSFYKGSVSRETEVDPLVTEKWGVLATPKQCLDRDISGEATELKEGGLVLSDSRLLFSITRGFAITIGCPTKIEHENWGLMDIPDSDENRAKVEELKGRGIHMRCAW
ncbi:ca2+:h+ antiporter [Fusarium langsethiae]|uniref:Ca2+:h+ antiporter n=1 Tax=Fusarium langsethiae TaxID=179993 RepID=A0A0N0V4S2_FUSLA|nr:ca2+:h+ antiporter [Fusarium langsethiae]